MCPRTRVRAIARRLREVKHSHGMGHGHPEWFEVKWSKVSASRYEFYRHYAEPMHEGKPEAFWHLTSETDPETGERLPNLRRCERLRWAKALITEVANRDDVVTWRERRRDGLRQLFALDDFSYLVVVALRSRGRMYLATAYPVDMEWRRTKLHKQFNRASQKGGG